MAIGPVVAVKLLDLLEPASVEGLDEVFASGEWVFGDHGAR